MEPRLRLVGAIQLVVSWLVFPILLMLSYIRIKKLPAIRDPVLFYSASALAVMIKSNKLTSECVMESYINRIKAVNKQINAIVEERFCQALKEAKEIDEMLASSTSYKNLAKDKPFLGVPFTVKESVGVKGLSQSVGSRLLHGKKAVEDGAAVRGLRSAGAVPLAVTNTPEMCLCWDTANLLTGRTNNPYNNLRSAGGSSGGEGALLGAGASVIGIAADVAGSIRIPALFNGVYGHKPTAGVVSNQGHVPCLDNEDFNSYMSVGPMARYAEDLKPMLKVMAGDNNLRLDEPVDISTLTIFYKYDCGNTLVGVPVASEIMNAIKDACSFLKRKFNCHCVEGDFNELVDSVETSGSLFFGIDKLETILPNGLKNAQKVRTLYLEFIKSLFGHSENSYQSILFLLAKSLNMFIPKDKYNEYKEKANALKKKFQKSLGSTGVLLYPTFPIPALHHHEFTIKTAGVIYTMIFNVLGMPATHVPTGLNSKGLPIGFQVVGWQGEDRLCLAVAEALEQKFKGWQPPTAGCSQ